ncbi:hypothetical protein VTJ83DRAFT_2362 [Remersonia thermophila]|uniref:Glycosyl transferase family 17 protein n=1 Tax=Remersonia thermophila TaxID=72144 RepID=A0ABR4DIH7_9PEZI
MFPPLSRHVWSLSRTTAFLAILWLILRLARDSPATTTTTTTTSSPSSHSPHAADADADAIARQCRLHGWKPFLPAGGSPRQRRKVYDLVLVNTELDQLEIRLNTTFAHVDYYVLVESARTFTYRPKPLHLRAALAGPRFAPYASKLVYHELEFPPGYKPRSAWQIEALQRNALFTQVFPRLARERDVAGSSSSGGGGGGGGERAPSPGTRFYYYSFQWLHRGPEWPHPQATYYQGLQGTVLPEDLRMGIGGKGPWPLRELRRWWERGGVSNASWHCSSCFATVGEVVGKMGSFSHVGLNKARFRERGWIVERVRNGRDLWDRKGEAYDRVDNNTDVPEFVRQNRDRFAYMLDRDGPSAGFVDSEPEKGGRER